MNTTEDIIAAIRAGEMVVILDDEALRASDRLDADDLADAIDVPCHDVAVERIARPERRLEIHA